MLKKILKYRINIIEICVFSIISFVAPKILDKINGFAPQTKASILLGVWVVSLLGIIKSLFNIESKRRTEKYYANLPYNFDYLSELRLYRCVGNKKASRHLNGKAEYLPNNRPPQKYTEWKECLLDRNKKLFNDENFFAFLRKNYRVLKIENNNIILAGIPIFVFFASNYIPSDLLLYEKLFVVAFASIILLFFYRVIVNGNEDELSFIEDVCEVLCPEHFERFRCKSR